MRRSKCESFFAEKSFLFPFWQARSWQRRTRRESTNPNTTMTAKSLKRNIVPRKSLPPKSSAFRLHQHQQLPNQLPLPLPRTVPFQKSLANSMFTLHQCGLAMLWKVSLSSWTLFSWSKNRYIFTKQEQVSLTLQTDMFLSWMALFLHTVIQSSLLTRVKFAMIHHSVTFSFVSSFWYGSLKREPNLVSERRIALSD